MRQREVKRGTRNAERDLRLKSCLPNEWECVEWRMRSSQQEEVSLEGVQHSSNLKKRNFIVGITSGGYIGELATKMEWREERRDRYT